MPPDLCGLKVADGWEGIVNTAFYGDTLMRLIYRVLLRVDFVELLQLYFLQEIAAVLYPSFTKEGGADIKKMRL